MGQWSSTELEMKSLLLVFATLCSAAPDADPAFAYSVGTPYVYHAPYTYLPYVNYVVPATGCRNNLGAVVPCNGAVPLVAAAAPAEDAPEVEAVDRKKRDADADADADADPAVLLTRSYISHPLTYYHYPYSYGLPYVYGRKKRDADADADPAVLLTRSYISHPLTYYHYPYTYGLPYVYGRKKRDADADATA